MTLNITATTVDGHINTALTHLANGSYVEARRYVVMAQTAKQALHKSEAEDGKQHTWDTKISEILKSIDVLEASEAKSASRKRTIKVRTGFGR